MRSDSFHFLLFKSTKDKRKEATYFFKKSSSTTAEMSRRGLPIPRRTPSKAIIDGCEKTERGERRDVEYE